MTNWKGSQNDRNNYGLPSELWLQVLVDVPPQDLCEVVNTSNLMKSLANESDLWTGMPVNLRKVQEEGLAPLYLIDRFKKIVKIDFSGIHELSFSSEQLGRLLRDIPGSPLESIDWKYVDLSGAPPELLATSISCLKTVSFKLAHLTSTTYQLIKMFEAILASNSLENVDFTQVWQMPSAPAELLASAVCRLKTINFDSTHQLSSGESVGASLRRHWTL